MIERCLLWMIRNARLYKISMVVSRHWWQAAKRDKSELAFLLWASSVQLMAIRLYCIATSSTRPRTVASTNENECMLTAAMSLCWNPKRECSRP
ncbi:hypothetical protein GQ54DRAFT_170632 [Martensiomyces pterosporus]|nr:hypothetical protein GQ54DRAFT_170632 [Martensiomyces pterosporus]